MRLARFWTVLVLTLTLTLPVFARSGADGPKSWFHSHHRGSKSPHRRGNQAVTKPHATKHSKPFHPRDDR